MPWRFYAAQIYERVVYVAVFGAIAVQLVLRTIQESTHAADPTQIDPIDRTGVGLVLSFLGCLVLLKALLAVGPISVSAAMATWLLGSPLSRRRFLMGRFSLVVLSTVIIGVLWPVFLSFLTGFSVRISTATVVLSAAVAVGSVSVAVCIQASRAPISRAVHPVLTVGAWTSTIVLLINEVVSGRMLAALPLGRVLQQIEPLVIFLAPVITALLTAAGIAALGRLRRSAVSSGRAVVVGLMLAITSFEFGLLGSIMTERRAIRLGYVRSVPLGGASWLFSVIGADLVRLARAPGKLFAAACLLLVPVLYDSGVSGPTAQFLPAVFMLAAFLVADRLAGTQRIVIRSAALRRLLGIPGSHLNAALVVVPLVGTTIWCILAASLVEGLSPLNIAVASIGSVLVVLRIATRGPLSYDDSSFFDFGAMGPAPLGLLRQMSRGPTLLLTLMLVQVVLP